MTFIIIEVLLYIRLYDLNMSSVVVALGLHISFHRPTASRRPVVLVMAMSTPSRLVIWRIVAA